MEEKIQRYYRDPSFGLTGLKTFTVKYRALFPETTTNQIKQAVEKLSSYALHKDRSDKAIQRRPYIVPSEFFLWSIDLCFLHKLAKWNDNVHIWLTVVDVFSKKTYVEPLKSKSSADVAAAFERILETVKPQQPIYVISDQGGEFGGRPFQRMLKRREIGHYFALSSVHKASHSENRIRTLKSKIYRYLTASDSKRYVHVMKDIVNSINATPSYAHSYPPSEVNIKNSHMVFEKLYPKYLKELRARKKEIANRGFLRKRKERKPRTDASDLRKGDRVRISIQLGKFQRATERRWNPEIFQIYRVKETVPKTYELRDEAGEVIKGSFYKGEIQRVRE